jgi:hypothetical protein
MPEDTKDSAVLPKRGESVSGMTIVDPVADITDLQLDQSGAAATPKTPKKATKKDETGGPSAESVRLAVEKALNDEALSVEIVEANEHPRGPAVLVKRLPDVTRPIAYVDTGDHTWATSSLGLNIYGFLDAGTVEELQSKLKAALGLQNHQVVTFTRF